MFVYVADSMECRGDVTEGPIFHSCFVKYNERKFSWSQDKATLRAGCVECEAGIEERKEGRKETTS